MNPVHVHLMLNHLPLIGTAFTLVLLLVAFAKKSDELKRVSLAFLAGVTLLAVPAYLTGEPAEEAVEHLPGIETPFIEPHEEAAKWAFGAQIALGVVALAGLFVTRKSKPLPAWCAGALLVLSLAVCGLMARAANLGGQIRHPEIRSTASPPPAGGEKHHD